MELKILDDMEIILDPKSEVHVPEYVTRLLPEEVLKEDDPRNVIIAAGSDPKDGKITLITLEGKTLLFDARRFYIPDGPAVPASGGKEVFLENVDGRWPGDVEGFYVESKWMIEKSASALTGAVLRVNYRNEDKPK